jgi:dynein intermediate chain
MSSVQQRKAEILAKRAKLAELRRQRELRQKEFSQSRASTGGEASEVRILVTNVKKKRRF